MPNESLRIGGKRLEELDRDQLIRALEERLRVNVGLVAENAKLRKGAESFIRSPAGSDESTVLPADGPRPRGEVDPHIAAIESKLDAVLEIFGDADVLAAAIDARRTTTQRSHRTMSHEHTSDRRLDRIEAIFDAAERVADEAESNDQGKSVVDSVAIEELTAVLSGEGMFGSATDYLQTTIDDIRAEDQQVWLDAFLPLLPESKREFYREQIRVAFASQADETESPGNGYFAGEDDDGRWRVFKVGPEVARFDTEAEAVAFTDQASRDSAGDPEGGGGG